jgi:hypothetical protein
MKNCEVESYQRELQIAKFKEKLFATVTFEAFKWKGEYRYRVTNGDGRSLIITTRQLFSQTKTRIKIADLTMTVLPYMKQAEYGEFVHAVMDFSKDIDDKSHCFDSQGNVLYAVRVNG